MQIPTTIKVGRHTYRVQLQSPGPGRYGCVNYQECVIRIRPRKEDGQALTFWHELTHAILNEMGHPLTRNEAFVEIFSGLLHKAVKTARFA